MSSNDLKTSANDAAPKDGVGSGDPDPKEQSFVSHLVELRNRLLRSLAGVFVVLICSLCCCVYLRTLYIFSDVVFCRSGPVS